MQIPDFTGFVILITDDMDINRAVAAALLEDTGAEIEQAENGKEAAEAFEREPGRFNLILMDVKMPVMSGTEATERIRASGLPNAASIPIIAMEGSDSPAVVAECVAAGMNNHLSKPLDPEAFLKTLAEYLL
jgi:CheY-like chemotaxis protein